MLELAADKLAEDIKAVSYDFENFCNFGDEVLELPFLFEENPVASLTMVSTGETKSSKKGKPPLPTAPPKLAKRRAWKPGGSDITGESPLR